jgi:hypothetical protein
MSGAAASAFGAAGVPPQHALVSGEKQEVQQAPPQGATTSSAASTLAGDEQQIRNEQGDNVNVKRAEEQFEVS